MAGMIRLSSVFKNCFLLGTHLWSLGQVWQMYMYLPSNLTSFAGIQISDLRPHSSVTYPIDHRVNCRLVYKWFIYYPISLFPYGLLSTWSNSHFIYLSIGLGRPANLWSSKTVFFNPKSCTGILLTKIVLKKTKHGSMPLIVPTYRNNFCYGALVEYALFRHDWCVR